MEIFQLWLAVLSDVPQLSEDVPALAMDLVDDSFPALALRVDSLHALACMRFDRTIAQTEITATHTGRSRDAGDRSVPNELDDGDDAGGLSLIVGEHRHGLGYLREALVAFCSG
jgi:hypothetical protein